MGVGDRAAADRERHGRRRRRGAVAGRGATSGRAGALPADAPLVLYTGTFEPYQGVDLLHRRGGDPGRSASRRARVLVVGGEPQQVERARASRAQLRRADSSSPASSRRARSRASSQACDVLVSPRISRHQHAAEDLLVPALGPADRRHQSADAHAGADAGDRRARRRRSRGLRGAPRSAAATIRRRRALAAAAHGGWPTTRYSRAVVSARGRARAYAAAAPRCAAGWRPRRPGAGAAVTVLVTGATGFTGGHLARHAGAGEATTVRGAGAAASRAPVRRVAAARARRRGRRRRPDRRATRCARLPRASTSSTTSPRPIARPGSPTARTARINVDGTQHVLEARARRRRAAGRALQHRRRARAHRQPAGQRGRAVQSRRHLSGHQARGRAAARASSAATSGLDVVVARPIGIYGPGDTRFLKMFRGIARGRFPMLGSGEVFYHLTYIDDLVRGLPVVRRRCPPQRGAPTSSPARDYTTLERAGRAGGARN